ncbi:O-antigen ligase domain-containing protein [Rhizobium sp. KAs_5_22]|nr:O-antigen ligase domain-containing protein [Rhizobium sp. KAs_5_22]
MALVYSGYILAWVKTSGTGEDSFVEIAIALAIGMSMLFAASYKRTVSLTAYHVLYLLPILLYFLVSVTSAYYYQDTKIFLWLLFGVVYLGLLSQADIAKSRVVDGFLMVGLIELMFFLAFNREAIFSYSGGRGRVSFDNSAYTLTAYAIAGGTLAALYSMVFMGKAWLRSIAVLGLSIIVILGTGTRSVLVGLVAAVFSLYFFNRIGKLALRRVVIYTGTAFVIAALVFSSVPSLRDRLANTLDLMMSGVSTLSGSTEYEASAEGRRISREIGIDNFMRNPLTGAGYRTRQLDFPLLQSYQDFGIFFGLAFTFAFLVLPYLVAFKAFRRGTDSEKFIAALFILNSPRLFLHGTTYDWVIFTYVIPVYSVLLNRPEWGLLFASGPPLRPSASTRMENRNV